ncbi:LysM peptidoglycan-binding domain-containing protein [Flavobacterium sp. J49]|uniref:LysM peptidoglycan-binding domain-containing protein n=1 Tax=Flavobacterium sp. J49 TaxID=2718534 RepID=UPI001593CD69|nr:LysM peptidoglycan-binding domain-containing protein [Flavobacterium sp. J49]MBF6641423.1 LysM peptidoglycan-binding domain-containing protein [Flavobacterium sp. J49]NIC02670.1 LysM peptidoglycan-binding domain-containing protein [Flavobacterium sp. J49]
MNIRKITTLALLLASSAIFAQDTIKVIPVQAKLPKRELTKREVLDSIKASFVHDNIAKCIDSMWMKELASLDLYNELTFDIKNIDVDHKVDYELPTELLKERLKAMDEKSPFNIEYNQGLENVIKSFLKNRKRSFERLIGISQYYFPMFEESLAAQNIPLEIKYLSVVESALNPRAVSRVGATGLWQFMYQTGKQYGLKVDTYVDERSDPLKASNAATQYMKNMYAIFGDWDLVLASYNTGPGNVAKAIRRSGGKQNYWNIRPYLHKETQGYVPAFLATMYIFEYHKEHGIKPDRAIANHFATDTVMVKRALTFKQIADLLDVSVAELQFLNPSYKREEVPYISGQKHFLRLPVDKIAVFTSNEDKIYAYADYEFSKRERPFERTSIAATDFGNIKYHKVRRGESLSKISDRYGVTVSELKKWNRLKSSKAPLGRSLKIYVADNNTAIASNESKPSKVTDTTVVTSNSNKIYKEEKVVAYKDVVKYHKVRKGDNLGEISGKYGVSVAEVKKWNKLKSNNIALGANLKIIKNERVVTTVRREVKADKAIVDHKAETAVASNDNNVDANENPSDYYEVQRGDNLFSIAKKFNVSLEDLKKWNNLNDLNVQSGSKLALVNKEETVVDEEPKTETKIVEHKVRKGEYLSSIAKKYNVSLAEIKEWNELEDNNVKLGQTLIVSKKEVAINDTKSSKKESIAANERKEVETYYVKKGDSLFSIAKKYPGVTISDIKKWNGIKNESLKPGMKLKINNG